MTLLRREADEAGGAAQRFDCVLQRPYLRLPLLLAIEAEVQPAANLPDLRGQPLIISNQGLPPGAPLSGQLRRLLRDVGVQRPQLFTLLLEVGQSGFIRRLVRLQRHIVGAEGFLLLLKPFGFRYQAPAFCGPLLPGSA